MQIAKSSSHGALAGIWIILLSASVMATLYLAQAILIPLTLAALLTFLLAPVVTRMERWIGRIAAVLIVMLMLFIITGLSGWVFTSQLVGLARKMPDYKENIEGKLLSFKMPGGGVFSRLSHTVEEIKKDVVGPTSSTVAAPVPRLGTVLPATSPPYAAPVLAPETGLGSINGNIVGIARTTLGLVLGPLGTGGLILLLVVIMLLQREDLRGRLIRLIGKGHISHTTHAMDDAGSRVSRYLLLQLGVNASFGLCIGTGLSLTGMPTAVLCGMLAAVFRFIPYVGPWVAAVIPITLSLAISNSWMTPLMVIGLFVALELLLGNLVEPWLYGSSTGVAPMALIVAAVFWTWLWGPVGLVLSTPLTVCLVVMGRHVPKLEFLSVLLSDEKALTPHEECYYRLLAQDLNKADELVETFLKANSTTTLYDTVLIPVIIAAETDCRCGALDEEECGEVLQSVRDLVEDLETQPIPASAVEAQEAIADVAMEPSPPSHRRILCLPARAERDELAGMMLVQLLRPPAFDAQNISVNLTVGEAVDLAEKSAAATVCISVVAPSTVVHARYRCAKLRARMPHVKIVVGLWGGTDNLTEASQRLRKSGADEIVTSLGEAVTQLTQSHDLLLESRGRS